MCIGHASMVLRDETTRVCSDDKSAWFTVAIIVRCSWHLRRDNGIFWILLLMHWAPKPNNPPTTVVVNPMVLDSSDYQEQSLSFSESEEIKIVGAVRPFCRSLHRCTKLVPNRATCVLTDRRTVKIRYDSEFWNSKWATTIYSARDICFDLPQLRWNSQTGPGGERCISYSAITCLLIVKAFQPGMTTWAYFLMITSLKQ